MTGKFTHADLEAYLDEHYEFAEKLNGAELWQRIAK